MRRLILAVVALGGVGVWLMVNPASYEAVFTQAENDGTDYAAEAVTEADEDSPLAVEVLEKLEVKGRAPKTGYKREEFYGNWPTVDGCNLRQRIIKREFASLAKGCTCPKNFPVCVCGNKPQANILKAVAPSAQEVEGNPRSRSARLRTAEKI